MPKSYSDLNELLRDMAETTAELKAESLSAWLLAAFALELLIKHAENKEEAINKLGYEIDGALNKLTFTGEGDRRLNEKMRELARDRCHRALAEMQRRLES